jgi:hypothetical protein
MTWDYLDVITVVPRTSSCRPYMKVQLNVMMYVIAAILKGRRTWKRENDDCLPLGCLDIAVTHAHTHVVWLYNNRDISASSSIKRQNQIVSMAEWQSWNETNRVASLTYHAVFGYNCTRAGIMNTWERWYDEKTPFIVVSTTCRMPSKARRVGQREGCGSMAKITIWHIQDVCLWGQQTTYTYLDPLPHLRLHPLQPLRNN